MKHWRLWIGVIISAVFLWWALRGLKLSEVWADMLAANYWWLIPAVLSNVLSFLVRAERWRHLMAPIKRIRIGPLFSAFGPDAVKDRLEDSGAKLLIKRPTLRRSPRPR